MSAEMSPGDLFYVTAGGDAPGGGIHVYRQRGTGEDWRPEEAGAAPLPGAGYLAFSPDRRLLYATCDLGPEDGVASFAIGPDGLLTPLASAGSGGRSTCHLSVAPDGRFVFAANYSGASVAVFAVEDGGRSLRRTLLIPHSGSGPNLPRQDAPHPHFVRPTPDGKFLAVADLGLDVIRCYPLEAERGLDPAGALDSRVGPPGAGPRHLVFDRSGKMAYLLNELANTVISCRYEAGRFTAISQVPTLPRGVNVYSKAAAVRLSPDGRFLVATNRGYDSLAVFALDGRGGMARAGLVLSGGGSPRDFNFLPGGKTAAAANESGALVFFDYNAETGELSPNGILNQLPRPLCVAGPALEQ